MVLFLSFFICLSSVLIYFFSYIWQFNQISIISSFLISFLISLFYFPFFKNNFKIKENFISKFFSLFLILIFLIAIAVILSPLIITARVEGFTFLRFPGVNDYNKHLYVTGTIYNSGVPPLHPYFPLKNLSYYLGYYIIPAAISALFNITPNISLFFFIILTTILSFLLIKNVIYNWIKNLFWRLLSLTLIITGTGIDIIPTFILEKIKFGSSTHIELWSHLLGNKLMVSNTPVAALWTPQHFFAGALTIYLINYLLTNKKISIPFLSVIISFIFLSSSFIAFTLIFWLFLIFIFKIKLRKKLLIIGIISLLLSLPFILFIFRNPTYNIFQLGVLSNSKLVFPKIFQILSFFIINLPLEFGIIGVLTLILALKNTKLRNPNHQLIFLGLTIPLTLIIFITSVNWNDFGMRTILPVQLVIPIVLASLLERMKTFKVRSIIVALILINILFSSIGLLWEFYWRWKERKLFTIEESLLYLKLRQEEKTKIVSTLDTSFWASYIPVFSFHPLYSPSLHDSRIYLDEKTKEEIDKFNNFLEKNFTNPMIASTPQEIISQRNEALKIFPKYIKTIPSSLFILRNHNVLKGWLNTYKSLFDKISNASEYSLDFSTYNLEEIKEKIDSYKIFIDGKSRISINPQKTNKIFLSKDLYLLVGCKKENKSQEIEILNRYLFSLPKESSCAGQFFAPEEEGIYEISQKQNLVSFEAFPVKVIFNQ